MTSQPVRKWTHTLPVTLLAVLIALISLTTGCDRIGRKRTLIVASEALPDNMIPIMRQNSEAKMLNDLIYSGLAGLSGRRQSEIQTELAASIEQNLESRGEYFVTLREDVVWHDGRAFNAKDVMYTWDAIQEEANDSPLRGRLTDIIVTMEMLDDSTIKVNFKHPVAPDDALWLLAFKILPSQYMGQEMPVNLKGTELGRAFASNPIGTGRFQFIERKSNQLDVEIPDEEALIRRVRFRLQRDPNLRTLNLIKKRVDVIFNVDPEAFPELDKANIPHADYTPKTFYGIAFNMEEGITTDKHFRYGVAAAINREVIAGEIFGEDAGDFILDNAFPYNDHQLYRSLPPTQEYDIEYAIEQLTESEYNGEVVELTVPEQMGSAGRIAGQRIAEMLGEAGVEIKLVQIGTAFQTQLAEGRYRMALVLEDGFGRKYDHYSLYHSLGTRNVTRVQDQYLDKMITDWNNSIVMDTKFPLTVELNRILGELAPYVYLYTVPQRVYYSTKLSKVLITDEDALLKTASSWSKE